MQLQHYNIERAKNGFAYEFISVGPKGSVNKIVVFERTGAKNSYNLGFGDRIEASGTINDIIVTNNGDSQKILETIAAIVFDFTNRHPAVAIFATGSTVSRIRFYRMNLSKNIDWISQLFDVFGYRNNQWESFNSNSDYEVFCVIRKS